MKRRTGAALGLLLSLDGAVAMHLALRPDAAGYAHGAGWWSSPLAALAGLIGGYTAVAALAVLCCTLVGWHLGQYGWRGVLLYGLLLSSPFGWALINVGADAVGVWAFLRLLEANEKGEGRARALVLGIAAHAVAGLGGLGALAGRRLGAPYWVGAATVGLLAMVGEPLAGLLLTGARMDQVQWRYLAPACAAGIAHGVRWAGRRPKTVARKGDTMKRALQSFTVVAVAALALAAVAGATTTDPPVINASDLTPVLYAVGAALLTAVLAIIAPVYLTKVPFAIVNVVNKALHKLTGRAKPAAG